MNKPLKSMLLAALIFVPVNAAMNLQDDAKSDLDLDPFTEDGG
jgi:hypothetical protein